MCVMSARDQPSTMTLSTIFNQHADMYCQAHTLTPEQYKVVHAIKNCRTSALGGHVAQCDHCYRICCVYNSCRNRHCPTCGSFKAAQWLSARETELLPVRYFHVVFTLPHELNNLTLYNKRFLYNLLFESAWETLNTLGKDPNRLHGDMGMLSILHTWGQNLSQHNHVHCIVPGGALKLNGKWVSSKKYLFPVNVLSKLFRGLFVSKLRSLYQTNQLTLPDQLTETLRGNSFEGLLDLLMQKDWVVYAKPPFGSPEQVLNYLGRYTHKIALSNYRLISCDEEAVTFKWRDYADDNQEKIMSLKPHEFMRRFLSHVLPSGFMRIRSFGFLANACKAKKIKIIQRQLDYTPKIAKEKKDTATMMLELTGKDITICPYCNSGTLKRIADIKSRFSAIGIDTS